MKKPAVRRVVVVLIYSVVRVLPVGVGVVPHLFAVAFLAVGRAWRAKKVIIFSIVFSIIVFRFVVSTLPTIQRYEYF
jgi:hypothetical protein